MTRRPMWIDLAIITAIALVVHGLLLLDTGIYFDDWVIYTYVVEKDWLLLQSMVRDRGIAPVEQHYWWMFRDLPVFAFKFAVFAMIVAQAWLATLLGRTATFLSRQESLLVAFVVVCYSGFQTWVLFCTSHYVFFYVLFLIGALLAFSAEGHQGWRHWGRRLLALALFATSYGLNSLLALTILLWGLLLLYVKKLHGLTWARLMATYLPGRLDYVIVPVVYWIAVRRFIPVQGLLEGYNQFLTSPLAIATGLQQFVSNAVVMPLRNGLLLLATHPIVIGAALLIAISLWRLGKRSAELHPTGAVRVVAIGVLWMASAMFAYAVVGKPAAAAGWGTRHALLMAFPLGVTMVGLGRIVSSHASHLSFAGVAAVVVLASGMALSTISIHVELQARAVKDRSVMQQLVAMPLARESSVFWVHDMLPQPFGESYRFFEWTGMFERAFGDQRRIGLDRQVYQGQTFLTTGRHFFIARYRLKDFDPAGCQVDMRITWGNLTEWGLGSPPAPWRLVARYQWLRWFGGHDRLTRFLNEVTQVTLQPHALPEARHCRRL
jgi:hypothetical protein